MKNKKKLWETMNNNIENIRNIEKNIVILVILIVQMLIYLLV
jgi:hypothetical protein